MVKKFIKSCSILLKLCYGLFKKIFMWFFYLISLEEEATFYYDINGTV